MLLNADRAEHLMREHGLDALVGTSLENVTYLTGHVGWSRRVYSSRHSVALFTPDGKRSTDLILNRSDITYYSAHGSSADRVHTYGEKSSLILPAEYEPGNHEEATYLSLYDPQDAYDTVLDALVGILKERGVDGGNVGIDEHGCTPQFLEGLRGRLPNAKLTPSANLFLLIRLQKTAAELDRLRTAAWTNDRAAALMLSSIEAGMTEMQAASIWRQEVARLGGMWHWLHFGSGPRSAGIFPPSDRVMRSGELFMFDCGLFHDNYNADWGGCGFLGKPPKQVVNEFGAIEEGVAAALSIVREGVTASEIYRALIDGIKAAGLREFESPFAGHTIGLEAREFPFTLAPEILYKDPFLRTSDIPLPANATINIEAPIGRMGSGGYQLERTVIVTETGWEALIDQDCSLRVIPA